MNPVLLNRIRTLEEQVKILKTRQGDFSRSAKVLTINADTVTADYHDHFMLQPETGISDDLVTINGGSDGRRIVLHVQDSGDTITVKNNTGNILLGADQVLDNQADTLHLIYSASLSKWIELAFHDTSGGSADTEAAQDAVGTILLDSNTIDFTYDDTTPSITAIIKFNDVEGDPGNVSSVSVDGTSIYPARRDHIHTMNEDAPWHTHRMSVDSGTRTIAAGYSLIVPQFEIPTGMALEIASGGILQLIG